MKTRTTALILAMLVLILFLAACSSGASTTTSPTTALDGATLVQERCSKCHTLDRIINARGTATEWGAVVQNMVARGAQLSPEEQTTVINYLATTYGK
jgi:mono/diheme cytochrome c family protein